MKSRWILILLTILFLWVVISQFTELKQFESTLTQGDWRLLGAAILMQVCYYAVFAGSYQAAFYTVNIRTRIRDLIPVTLGSLFVNVVVPAGGAGGAALFTQDLTRRGKPAAGAAVGVLLQLAADFSAFLLLLIPGLLYLSSEHDLQLYEILAGAILLLITAGLTGLLLLGIWKPDWLGRLLRWSQGTANWLFGRLHRSLSLAEDWAAKNTQAFTQAAEAVTHHPLRLALTVAVAFAAHLLNIATLAVLFRAFNQPVGPGVLVAGYGIGILFLVVSITPQGIGVVEGMMMLTFTSLGIPAAVATTVALAFRGLTFWLPLLLGFFAVQRMRTIRPKERSLTGTWGVRVAAGLVALMGVVNVISAVTPALAERMTVLETRLPLVVQHGGRLTAALAGFALLMLAGNLSRRKRVAWLLTLVVLSVSIVSHLVKGLDYEEALAAAGLMVLLLFMRAHFHARSDRPSAMQGLRVLTGALLFTVAYGVTGFYLLDRHFQVNFGFRAALHQTVILFTQFYDPGLVPITRFGRFFASSIYVIGAVTLAYAGFMLLRPVFIREPATPDERAQARAIVEKYGHSSLARLLLLDDKKYLFTPGGSLIGYTRIGRTAVTLGDPIGPADDLLPAVQEFSGLCTQNDWMPVFYQTLPETLAVYQEAGFKTLCIGEEAVVNLTNFSLEGKAGKPLRIPYNKLNKAGYRFEIHQPPIPEALLGELRTISDEWLTTMHGTEKGFSLGWFDNEYIRGSVIGAVYAPEGDLIAFANLLPEYQAEQVAIDLMRHRKEIENGTMEFLFVSLFQWARSEGYQGFDLGLSALSGVGEQAHDPAVERMMHFVFEHINQFYNFKGLHAFKEKFHPQWSPRYLVYTDAAHLGQAWWAVVKANSGSSLRV